jgi:protein SCO1
MKKLHILLVWLICAVAATAVLGAVLYKIQAADLGPRDNSPPGLTMAGPVGGAFNLIDENGQAVTDQSYKTPYKLIFFGFTRCPDICPAALLKVTDVMAALPAAQAAQVTPLFITVDVDHDTPAVLKDYTANFDPRIVGLTGTQDQIDAAVQAFKVYAAKMKDVGDHTGRAVTFDHSGFLYLTDQNNHIIMMYRMGQDAAAVAADMGARLVGHP